MEKRKKMKTIALVVLYLMAIIPIIKGSITIMGVTAKYQYNFSNFNFGLVFNLVFLAMMVLGLIAVHYRQNMQKIMDWVIIVLVLLLALLGLALKDSSESFTLGYYILWLDWLTFVLLKFAPQIMDKVYDTISSLYQKVDHVLRVESENVPVVEEEPAPAE